MSKTLNPKIENYRKFKMLGVYNINYNNCDNLYFHQPVNFVNKNYLSTKCQFGKPESKRYET